MAGGQYNQISELYEDLSDVESLPSVRNAPRQKLYHGPKRRKDKPHVAAVHAELAHQEDTQEGFDFSYRASRHERWWLLDSLGDFYENQWIDDVLRLLKGGKEASVYQCTANASAGLEQGYIAAKVYRPRQLRNLRKDHIYREGRQNLDADGNVILDGGMNHAMRKRTQYGQELLHSSWIEHEFKTLQILHAAEADVPAPYARGPNAILMGYVGGDEMPAPTLNTIELDRDETRLIYERLVWNIDRMLANQRVHGDLSAYNVLYWEGQVTLIDFPQAIHPEENRNAYRIFERDVTRLCEYFARQGLHTRPRRLAMELWKAHGYHIMPEVHPSLLDADDARDREYWKKTQGK